MFAGAPIPGRGPRLKRVRQRPLQMSLRRVDAAALIANREIGVPGIVLRGGH